jgi:hypothetical protein
MVIFTQPAQAVLESSHRKMLDDVVSREKLIKAKWLDKTKDIYEIYEGGKADETPFNILYSNTEILVPNLFSSTPRPVVRKRFGEMRADEASQAAERMAEYCLDTNLSGYPDFVEAIEAAVLDSALPGQGQCRVRVVEGQVCLDYVQHDRFIWAYAQRWEDTPWIAYRLDKTVEDLAREFSLPPEVVATINKPTPESSSTKDTGPATLAVYEVWNKVDRTVYFLCEAFPQCLIKQLEDPLQLSGFYPSCKPLRLLATPRSTMPRSMYGLYRRQADELNAITLRIKRITQAIKVRGIYDSGLPEMAQIFDSGDSENSLIPASNPGVMARDGGLDKHIWLVPVEKLVSVLQTLFQIREGIKSTIYEILGIGDILRGVSQASETASAQQIKDKWGSLRIKKSREKVNVFIRSYLRMMVEASAKHVPEEIWGKVTGLPFIPTIQAQVLAQTSPQPGSPPPPTSWGDILAILRDDLTRSYVIDIETNSTVDAAATEDKAEVAEFMNALGQAMTGLQGLASAGPEGFEASKVMLIEICKRFRMGNELQGVIMKMIPPPQGASPEQQKKEQELQQREKQITQGEGQVKQAGEGLKTQFDQQKQQLQQQADSLRQQQQSAEDAFRAQEQKLEDMKQNLRVMFADLDIQKGKLDLQAAELSYQAKEVDLQKIEALTAVKSASIQSKQPPRKV